MYYPLTLFSGWNLVCFYFCVGDIYFYGIVHCVQSVLYVVYLAVHRQHTNAMHPFTSHKSLDSHFSDRFGMDAWNKNILLLARKYRYLHKTLYTRCIPHSSCTLSPASVVALLSRHCRHYNIIHFAP